MQTTFFFWPILAIAVLVAGVNGGETPHSLPLPVPDATVNNKTPPAENLD